MMERDSDSIHAESDHREYFLHTLVDIILFKLLCSNSKNLLILMITGKNMAILQIDVLNDIHAREVVIENP